MPHGFNGWTYNNVVRFLRNHEFYFFKEKSGSHEAWIRRDEKGKDFVVEINVLTGGKTYPPLTLLTMIHQSGIDRKEWRKWG